MKFMSYSFYIQKNMLKTSCYSQKKVKMLNAEDIIYMDFNCQRKV